MRKNFKHKVNDDNLGKVLIAGKGISGRAAFDYLQSFENKRFECLDIVDENELDDSKKYDLCIVSPGIPPATNFFIRAKKISKEIISEVEFAYRESEIDSNWIAITGTNGKTTTTSLIYHILKTAGDTCALVGNIGDACISSVDGKSKIYCAEVSSYQLQNTSRFCPKAVAILNITPDHLSWHGSFENYKRAKFQVFENSKNQDDCYLYIDSSLVKEVSNIDFRCVVESDATTQMCALVENLKDEMKIKGEHNVKNAVCAASIANFFNIDHNAIKDALLTFKPLEHRIEPVGTFKGVEYFNDSKATNVDSTVKALSAFKSNVILLLGGKDKGTNLESLACACFDGEKVKKIICFGEARKRFADDLGIYAKKHRCDLKKINEAETMKDAFELAKNSSQSGDVVLLSPACASFDEFKSFEDRGQKFKLLFEDLIE